VLLAIVAAIVLLRTVVFRPRPIEVEVAVAARGRVEDVIANSQAGTVKSRRRARLGAEAAGRIASILHREGARVRAGAVLLELDDSIARQQLDLARRDRDAARASLASAEATATLAQRDHARVEALFQEKVVSTEQMDEARSRRDGAEAALAAARAQVERSGAAVRLAQETLDHLKVVAPFDGVITERFVEVGEAVIPGQAVLELMSPDRLYVSAPIDEIDVGRLKPGLPARVTLDPWPGVEWRGRLTRVAPYIQDVREQNRTLEVEVDLPPDPSRPTPTPGASADVEIVLQARDSVLRVPTFAVLEQTRVMVVENGHARTRRIEPGLRNWSWTEIRSGIEAGDVVITSLDKSGLNDGARVRAAARAAGDTTRARGAGG
jgi:HlyD family secretion protein